MANDMELRRIEKVEMMSRFVPDDWDSYCSLTSLLDETLGIDNCRSFEAMKLYKVTSIQGLNAARLWRCDRNGNPLDGQIIVFDDNGRLEGYKPIESCLYQFLNFRYFTAEAFFGGHLLTDVNHPVAIVQDEITCLVASQVEPRFTWLAVGHGVNLTKSLLAQLSDFAVTLFADDMNMEFWTEVASGLENVTANNSFVSNDINTYLGMIARSEVATPTL